MIAFAVAPEVGDVMVVLRHLYPVLGAHCLTLDWG